MQRQHGVGTTIKHYACNNQEENRRGVSSIVSERALREIYLKGFEIAIKESQPKAIMTSYNKVNGVHTANSYDLCTTAARKEWGFAGITRSFPAAMHFAAEEPPSAFVVVQSVMMMPAKPHSFLAAVVHRSI